jgi:glutamate carboxypeptidase
VTANPDTKGLLARCETHRRWLLDTIERLVRLESPSTDKRAVDRCGAAVAELLVSIGGTIERLPQEQRGDHVRAEWGAGDSQILMLGHFDTVWPVGQLATMPFHESNGRLYGPGIFDMKAGIAVAGLAVRVLQELGGRVPNVVMLWTTDEEIGSGTSRAVIEAEARRSAAVLVLEPSLPGGAAKTSRKGVGEFEVTVHGVPAHAGVNPGNGASAIHELARQILAIEALQDMPRGITVNVGVISGGSRTNVVAERASAKVDVRVPTMLDAARLEASLRSLRPQRVGTRLEITGGVERPPLERFPGVVRLYNQAKDVAAELGRDLGEGGTGGGSDGNFTASMGVPTLDGLGPSGDGAHALYEHVVLADLCWRAAFVAALVTKVESEIPG